MMSHSKIGEAEERLGLGYADLEILEKELSYAFKRKTLLKQALVHQSYLNEHRDLELGSNGRMAWLGDVVLYLAAADELYAQKVGDKGSLTELRKRLIRNKRAAEEGKRLARDTFLLLSEGEKARKSSAQKVL